MTKISDHLLKSMSEGSFVAPTDEMHDAVVSMANEILELRGRFKELLPAAENLREAIGRSEESMHKLAAVSNAVREGADTLMSHVNRINRDFPITARRITDILDAYRAACA